jgi:hypothetical protein
MTGVAAGILTLIFERVSLVAVHTRCRNRWSQVSSHLSPAGRSPSSVIPQLARGLPYECAVGSDGTEDGEVHTTVCHDKSATDGRAEVVEQQMRRWICQDAKSDQLAVVPQSSNRESPALQGVPGWSWPGWGTRAIWAGGPMRVACKGDCISECLWYQACGCAVVDQYEKGPPTIRDAKVANCQSPFYPLPFTGRSSPDRAQAWARSRMSRPDRVSLSFLFPFWCQVAGAIES